MEETIIETTEENEIDELDQNIEGFDISFDENTRNKLPDFITKDTFKLEDIVNLEDLKEYWEDITQGLDLQEDDTMRFTGPMFYTDRLTGIDIKSDGKTYTDVVNSFDSLKQMILNHISSTKDIEDKHRLGFSMSSSCFKIGYDANNKPVTPTSNNFSRTRRLVLDLDSHEFELEKGRYNFNSFNEVTKQFAAICMSNIVNYGFEKKAVPAYVSPSFAYQTGGGLQLIYTFDKAMSKQTTEKVFDCFRYVLPESGAKLKIFGVPEADLLGTGLKEIFMDFDMSSLDITHTQRVGGTRNPKVAYNGSFSQPLYISQIQTIEKGMHKIIDELSEDWILQNLDFSFRESKIYSTTILREFMISQQLTKEDGSVTASEQFYVDSKQLIKNEVSSILKEFFMYSQKKDANILNSSQLEDFGRVLPRKVELTDKHRSQLHNLDYMMIKNFIERLTPENQKVLFEEQCGLPKVENKAYRSYTCPFHDDNNASFAVYRNNGLVAMARDFHNDKTYNIISFLSEISKKRENQVDKTETQVVQDLSARFGLALTAKEMKSIGESQLGDTALALVNAVNMDDNIYYRRSNKQRDCIIRSYATGNSVTFDGSRMLTDHILRHQLKVKEADMGLRTEFHDLFVERILMGAFEEFAPGKDKTFTREDIMYVNLWIPGKNYEDIMKIAEDFDDMDIKTATELIKETLPASYFFLCQLTQKGSMAYFINWLACNAKFKTLPALPVITSVQGLGKNVFVKEWMEVMLNHQYVNVITSDKVSGQFNSFMETSSLIVLDEGDFNTTKDIDQLKFYTGNEWLQVEKKGFDMVKKRKHFNFIILTNGDTPLRHPNDDRRTSYFRGDISLVNSIQSTDYSDINSFIDCLRLEVKQFWAIISKVRLNKVWEEENIKNNQFNVQILKMHPFGKLVIQLIEEDWDTIAVQINENVMDDMVIKANSELIGRIKTTFYEKGYIELTMINKYIHSLNYKSYVGVQDFMLRNDLESKGIKGKEEAGTVRIYINREKLNKILHMNNNLGLLFPEYRSENYENTLTKLRERSGQRAIEEEKKHGNELIEEGLVENDNSDTITEESNSYLHNTPTQQHIQVPNQPSAPDDTGLPQVPVYNK